MACRRWRWRCTNGNAAIVKLLLEAGADANATMKGGETVLMLAARSGNVEAVKALLARGAKTDARERRGQTALMWAAAEGHTAVVRALIEAGADMKATVDSGFTPFFFAVREGHLDMVRAFLAAGIDVNAMMQRPASAPRRGRVRAREAGHESVDARGAERPLRAGDCAGRRGRRSERCANRIHSTPHDCLGAKAGFEATSAIPRRRPGRAAFRACSSCAKS